MIFVDDFEYINKEYLLFLKPKYYILIYVVIIIFIIVLICLLNIKTEDVYITRGYVNCDNNCKITISVNTDDINKVSNVDYIYYNNKKMNLNNINIGQIQVDNNLLNNYQIVDLEVDQLDYGINTFQDVKIYSNNEAIIRKIKRILF